MHLVILENAVHEQAPIHEDHVRACVVLSGYIVQEDESRPGTTLITRVVLNDLGDKCMDHQQVAHDFIEGGPCLGLAYSMGLI